MKSLIKKSVLAASLVATYAGSAMGAWYEDVTLKGDFRFRFQKDTDDSKAATMEDDRSRQRIRFRYGAYGAVNEKIDYGFRFASVVGGTDSRNQTLSGNLDNKSIGLDMAYVTMKVNDVTTVTAGKFKNPFWKPQKSPLMWDGDYTPEGLSLGYKNGSLFANLASIALDSDSKSNNVQWINALQVGFKTGGFAGALAYYGASSDVAGGGTDLTNGSEFLNVGLEYGFSMGSSKATLFGDYAINQDESVGADSETAMLLGINVKSGKFKYGLAFMDVGDEGGSGLQDSDFNGGKADTQGYRVNLGYAFAENSSASLTYFAWEDQQSAATAVDPKATTLQADLKFKF